MRKKIGGTSDAKKQKEAVKSDVRCGRFERGSK